MKTLLALAALALTLPFTASSAAAKECRGLKSAHCFCKTIGYQHVGTPGMPQANPKGQHFFTFTVPDQCFNPLKDALEFRLNKGCWLACRNAFGVEGHPQHPMVIAAKKNAGDALAKKGVCGGYMQAELHFAAGTNKFRNATGAPVAFGLHGWKTVGGKKVCQ